MTNLDTSATTATNQLDDSVVSPENIALVQKISEAIIPSKNFTTTANRIREAFGVKDSEMTQDYDPLKLGNSEVIGAESFIALLNTQDRQALDGLLKNILNYQGVDPADVGRMHQIVLGKHSGTRAVCHAYQALGIDIDSLQAAQILQHIRQFATTVKRSPENVDLMRFYQDIVPGEGVYHA